MYAQTREGGISPQMLQQIQRSQQASPADKAIRNAIAANNIDVLAKYGITAIIQPGGSIRDEESIAACDEYGIAMVFTGHRHFRH